MEQPVLTDCNHTHVIVQLLLHM